MYLFDVSSRKDIYYSPVAIIYTVVKLATYSQRHIPNSAKVPPIKHSWGVIYSGI